MPDGGRAARGGAVPPGRRADRRGGPAGRGSERDASVVRLVDVILRQAIEDGASDIHFEPFEGRFQLRYRIGGVLHLMSAPPSALAGPVVSRLKVLADLDIAEQRRPQDGRFQVSVDGRQVDLRMATLPTEGGECVVLRVLDAASVGLALDQLGIPPAILRGVRATVRRPHGILLATGPTGSGKTTTLYGALKEVNDAETKILTAEDPVEYEVPGLVQLTVNPAIGLSFAAALRAFLRQDPDKILVGEIRDEATARVAVQAALTGHLVLSTLHTRDAPGAVTRLLDLGVEPFLLGAALEGVLAQRLVRALCPECRRPVKLDRATCAALGGAEGAEGVPGHVAAGCETCQHRGYRGRAGLFEWMRLTAPLRECISEGRASEEIRRVARAGGLRSLREDGWRLVSEGTTSAAEILSCT